MATNPDALRAYQRRYAANRRAAKLLEQQRTASVCPKRHGSGVCGGTLETTSDRLGRTVIVCPFCERQRRGLCRDCSRPVEGRAGYALRCAEHKKRARDEQVRRSQDLHHDERLEAARRTYQDDPEKRAARNEYKRAYRKAHPEKTREQKRRAAMRDNAAHRRTLAWHRRHNRKKARALKKRQQAMLTYYREHPKRPVPKCKGCDRYLNWTPAPSGQHGRPPSWCDTCAPATEKWRRRRLGRSITTVDEPPPVAYLPPLRELEQKFGQPRTCIMPGCDIVVTGRKKKCSKCKAREAADATRILANHRGRGRRTDLEVAA